MLEESIILAEESQKRILESNSDNLSEEDMKKYIMNNFEIAKKKLSPERRKMFFKGLNSNLKEKYLFIKSLMEDFFNCDIHVNSKASFVSKENFQLICDQCVDNHSEPILISNDNKEEIINLITEMIKSASVYMLDKLHYKLLNTGNDFLMTTLIHLGKSIANKIKFSIPRCSMCFKKISFGKRSGVHNECKHITCFGCCIDGYYENCNVCKKKLIPLGIDVDIDINDYRIFCHHFNEMGKPHLLFNYRKNVYKLPCLHNICEMHLDDNSCQFCNVKYDRKKLKLNKQLMNIIEVLKIKCLKHERIALRYDTFSSKAYCKKCPEGSGIKNFAAVKNIINHKINELLIEKKLKDISVDQKTMKAVLNYRRLPLQTLYKLVRNYIYISLKDKDFDIKQFNRFHDHFPQKSSNRILEIKNKELVGFNIVPKKNILLYGLLIGKPIRRRINNKLVYSECRNHLITIKSIKENGIEKEKFSQISNYNKETKENEITKNVKEKHFLEQGKDAFNELSSFEYKVDEVINEDNLSEEDIFFKHKFCHWVKLKENKIYKLTLQTRGTFFHGRPFNRKMNDLFRIERMKVNKEKGEIECGNNAIGGIIFGFIYSENKFLEY